ncbi:MAG: hypothetical protein Q9227_007019 [Pyrenula ochraceoflavens]
MFERLVPLQTPTKHASNNPLLNHTANLCLEAHAHTPSIQSPSTDARDQALARAALAPSLTLIRIQTTSPEPRNWTETASQYAQQYPRAVKQECGPREKNGSVRFRFGPQ